MINIQTLKDFGADTAEGLGRCLNDEGFYLELVKSAIPDTKIDDLLAALSAGEFDRAFDLAHALKGMYGNLSLTPLFEPLNEITDLLRERNVADKAVLLGKCSALAVKAQQKKHELDNL